MQKKFEVTGILTAAILAVFCICCAIIPLAGESKTEIKQNIQKEHIFGLGDNEPLCFGGVKMFPLDFLETPITKEEYGVGLGWNGTDEDFYKIIKSFYANVDNFQNVQKHTVIKQFSFWIPDFVTTAEFFYGEKDGKSYILCDYRWKDKLCVRLQVCDIEKANKMFSEQKQLDEEEKRQKELEIEEKLRQEAIDAQIFPNL